MKSLSILIWIVVFLIHYSCQRAQPMFKKLSPRETSITFENTIEEKPLFNGVNYLYFYDGGGVALGDVNNDGLADIYFTANMKPNRLYLNRGDFRFEDVTETAGVGGGTDGWTTGATMADVNGDGFLDIYVCRSNYLDKKGANQLYINKGPDSFGFTERSAEYGLDHRGLSRQAAFFDYDLDDDLDMYLLNHSVHSKGTYGDTSLRRIRDYEAGDKLYRNENGHFKDVTQEAGIYESKLGYGLGVAIGDINRDGYPDIYVSNDFHENDYLYYNEGNGTFIEALTHSIAHTSSASMGNDLADFNNDGLLDIVVLDMLPEKEEIRKSSVSADPYDIYDVKIRFGYYHQLRRNTLQLNRGPVVSSETSESDVVYHLFSEIGQLADIHATDWSWAPLFVDLDNDGFKDLFVSNGILRRPNDLDYLSYLGQDEVRMLLGGGTARQTPLPIEEDILTEILRHMPSVPEANYAFHSQGDLTFMNRAGEWGLGDPGFSTGAAYADFDNDGAMDLVVNNVNSPAAIYRNLLYQDIKDSLNHPNYLRVKLGGQGENKFGIGAKVIVHSGEKLFFQELMPTRGFQSSVEPVLNFGLGKVERLDSLEIIWANGEYRVVRNLAVNQTVTLDQAEATVFYSYPSFVNSEPVFRDITDEVDLEYSHRENTFIEYNREPFIPHFLSTAGPALAVEDINGDGLEDVYLGGAKHQAGSIYLQDREGRFESVADSIFIKDNWSEDVDAAFFDADGDGIPDLYVVSGGNEFFGKMNPSKDRLYFGSGEGRFRKPDPVQAGLEIFANGACVEPADFDNDGDIDLFVGSRSVPREYGTTPESHLLINDGDGNFTNGTSTHAPELVDVGMVTDAVWVDLNNDSYRDLIVVGEWMPVTVFLNQNGELVNVTQEYGLQNSYGWWNTVAAGDFNYDGHTDLVVGNLGLNSGLKATQDEPVQLFINDFSGNGRPDQILTYYFKEQAYPIASRDLMLSNIPSLQAQYPSNADYAGQSIQDIFSIEQLSDVTVLKATEFASVLLLNSGDEAFNMMQLPAEAQFSPVYSILIEDFDGDGFRDVLLSGNFYGARPDQGRYDASYGCLLLGLGTGAFAPANLQESGFVVTGEVRHVEVVRTASGEKRILAARNNDTVVIFDQVEVAR
ncbi:MAG: VCBS repeat-containing protein [Candidatus Neomarinimicrobiota bacterium]